MAVIVNMNTIIMTKSAAADMGTIMRKSAAADMSTIIMRKSVVVDIIMDIRMIKAAAADTTMAAVM